jgi:hypothetical protein
MLPAQQLQGDVLGVTCQHAARLTWQSLQPQASLGSQQELQAMVYSVFANAAWLYYVTALRHSRFLT